MSAADYILVIFIIGYVLWTVFRKKKRRCSGCCQNCGGCGQNLHKQRT